MKTQSVLLALASAPAALAHTAFTNFYVNGASQGDGVAMRMRMDSGHATDPLPNIASNDMACNIGGEKGVSRVSAVQDGATLTFEFRSWPSDPGNMPMDRGHKGPCAVYLKKVDSAIDDPGHGDGWFKLFDDGYDSGSDKWCSDKLIDNNGLFSVKLPQGLKGGYYLARPELLALHAANTGDPQFYTGCAQIFLESNGDLVPEETVSIPGYVKAGEPALSFDIYNTPNEDYTLPGPSVAKLTSNSAMMAASLDSQAKQTEGLRPQGCICENSNWCGFEVSSYSDEKGCWAAGEECWRQADKCWDSAGPTGNAGCKIWQSKCQAINDACSAGNFQGPPNKGKDLTPRKNTIDVGLVLATQGGGIVDSPKTKAAEPKTSAAAQAKPTPAAAAPAPKPTPQKDSNEEAEPAYDPKPSPKGNKQKGVVQPEPTPVIPASEAASAPEPTDAPAAPATGPVCPKGYKCVWETVIKTEVVYVTAAAESKKRHSFHKRRHH